ncbi:hypothetical protein BG011_005988 [Mortierella polycephala]|uniref:RRM domain-containing protein n=1 Tax=Mortierella polycephala TaxID=41804 RepID=A0A9P6U070_9FUNG|nr:hypothetical protein BG011_005988 [Mortierella polycephala]
MNLIDQSLDDIIELQKLERKQKHARDAARKPKAHARVDKNGRFATSHLLYARPPRETALYTETYKALSAPVKEIYTSRYIPQTGPIKLYTINHQAKEPESLTTKPIRLVTTQQTKRGSGTSYYSKSRTDTRTIYRAGDYYRPSPRTPSSRNRDPIRYASELRSEKVSVNNEATSNDNSKNISPDKRNNSENPVCPKEEPRSPRLSPKVQPDQIIVAPKEEPRKSPDAMDTDEVIVIKGVAPLGTDLAIKGESGPATIEIHNLDPGTSAEDVKVVCSRFGEIRSCICSNGVAQVTYIRKPAGAAAVETLDGKKADNAFQILAQRIQFKFKLLSGY